ncbi:RNA 2'-phosphotransferase [Variovorax sp. GT1P44]|uniref:RNA 2'-phosphotransferase n=1 Tax=Variovorax sp. GT1P44 TaxID=3443742 RepID=UPI003F469F2A
MRPELLPISRLLARVLRHKPDLWKIRLDASGWCDVDVLLAGAVRNGCAITREQLQEIVATNDKRRFTMAADGRRIRAAQGHSVEVDLKLSTRVPPPVLYHGTVRKNLAAIRREGLRPMSRHAVHLSATKEAAVAVGSRRGVAVVLIVDSYAMNRAGLEFQQTENGVWLTAAVPTKYLNVSRFPSESASLPAGKSSSLKPFTQSEHEQIAKTAPKKRGKVIDSLVSDGGTPPPNGVQRHATKDE